MFNIDANNYNFFLNFLDENMNILQTDNKGVIEYASAQFCTLSGYEVSELKGKKCSIFSSGIHTKSFYKDLWSTIASAKVWKGEILNSTKNGKLYWLDIKIIPILDAAGNISSYISMSNEITELKNSHQKLNKIILNTKDIIYILNKKGIFEFVSPGWKYSLGHELDEVVNHSFVPFVHPEDVPLCNEYLEKILSKTAAKNESVVYRVFHKDGTIKYHQSRASIFEESASSMKFLAVASDITQSVEQKKELEKKNLELNNLAEVDYLTGLYNREKIDAVLKHKLSKFERYGNIFGVIMLDIDFFKDVNDTYGHQIGDEVLISISKELQKHSRESDLIGRWGGEEFLMISPYIDAKGLQIKAEHIRNTIEKYEFSIGHKTVSIGFSLVKEKDEVHTLIKRVDSALYEAKRGGRNRVCEG